MLRNSQVQCNVPECTCIASSNGGQAQVEVLEGGPAHALAVCSILQAQAQSAKTHAVLYKAMSHLRHKNVLQKAVSPTTPSNRKQPTTEMPVCACKHIVDLFDRDATAGEQKG